MLEFHADDTAADDKEDALVEAAFHVPPTCADWAPPPAPAPAADGADADADAPAPDPASKVLLEALLKHTDAGAASSDDAVATFADVAVLAPRGRFDVEMHAGALKLAARLGITVA